MAEDDLDEFSSLKIEGGNLYFNGERVRTGLRLEGGTLAAAWVAAVAAAVGALATLLADFDPILQTLQLAKKLPTTYTVVDRQCETEVHEHVIGSKVATTRIPHPCQLKTYVVQPSARPS